MGRGVRSIVMDGFAPADSIAPLDALGALLGS